MNDCKCLEEHLIASAEFEDEQMFICSICKKPEWRLKSDSDFDNNYDSDCHIHMVNVCDSENKKGE